MALTRGGLTAEIIVVRGERQPFFEADRFISKRKEPLATNA
jgi:hypothetical protein